MTKVLLVEDEKAISDATALELKFEDYEVIQAFDGISALEFFEQEQPDLVILDWMLPKLDGLTVLRRMKKSSRKTPVIFLTARDYVGDRVAGLDSGADDYLTKPFAIEELLARIRVLLRRAQEFKEEQNTMNYQLGALEMDERAHSVHISGEATSLTQREYNLLLYLMKHAGEAVSRADILDEVWGMNFEGQENTVDTYVRYLRGKLKDCSDYLETVRGIGYKLVAHDKN